MRMTDRSNATHTRGWPTSLEVGNTNRAGSACTAGILPVRLRRCRCRLEACGTSRSVPRSATLIWCVAVLGVCAALPRPAHAVPASLAENLDLAKIRLIAVQDGGRLKTFDSLARETIARLCHTESFEGQDPVLTYLDLMLDPASYRDRNIIHIKKHAVRVRL